MRKLIALLTIFSLNSYGAAPTGVGGEEGQLSYTNNLKAPAYTITSLGGVNSRIETGNTNLLANPSFEHPTVGTGWTATNATPSAETSIVVEGKKSLKLVLTGALTAYQDSTINAAQLVGLQGVAAIKVKNSGVTGLKACARNAGVTSTTLCVNIPNDNGWRHISIPFIMTATSNGIALTSTGTSGTVYVDDGFVGTSAPFQDVSGAKLVGSIKYAKTASCVWTTTSTSYANFAADTDCPTPTVTGSASAPATKIPAIVFSSLPAGDYFLVAKGRFGPNTSGSPMNSQFRFTDGTADYNEISGGQAGVNSVTTGYYLNSISDKISYSTSQSNITLQIKGVTSNAANAAVIDVGSYNDFTIDVYYYPPATKIYSQASQDYAYTNAGTITIGATTTAPTKGTIVTDRIMASRKGQNLIADFQYQQSTAGATGNGDYLFTLPSGLSFDSSVITPYSGGVGGNGSDSALQKALIGTGHIANGASNRGMCSLFAYDATRFRALCVDAFASYAYFGGSLYGLGGAAGTSFDFKVNAPIQGWSDYGVIVGSFAGIEKCANDYECTDTFSAQVSATGVVTNENLDWINGNCTVATGVYTCPLQSYLKDGVNGLSSTLNCVASAIGTTRIMHYTLGSSTTSQIVFTETDPSVAKNDIGFSIKCQKGSQDYKPKTAKVASSIGVPTVPGITTQAIDTFSFSYGTTNATTACTASPCSYLNQIGGAISSITRAGTGSYSMVLNKTYTALKCSGNANTSGAMVTFTAMRCESCSSLSFGTVNTATGGVADAYGTLVCQGSY